MTARWPVAVYRVPADPAACFSFQAVSIPDIVEAAPFQFVFRAQNALGAPVAGVNASLLMYNSLPFVFEHTLVPSDAHGNIVVTVTAAGGLAQPIFVALRSVVPLNEPGACVGVTQLAVFRFLGLRVTMTVALSEWVNPSTARIAVEGGASDVQLLLFSTPVVPSVRALSLVAVAPPVANGTTAFFDVTFDPAARGNFTFFARSQYQCSSGMVAIERPDTVASLRLLTAASDSAQPVVQVLDARGAPLAGVTVSIVNASLASRASAPDGASFDYSGVLASAPSDAQGRAVFSGLAFSAAVGTLCFSARYVDQASPEFEVLVGGHLTPGASGQNGVMRESASVCQQLSLARLPAQCAVVRPLPSIASFDAPFSGAVVSNCTLAYYALEAVSARTGARAAIVPPSVFVSAASGFAVPNITFVGGEAGDYRVSLGGLPLGNVTLVNAPESLQLLIDAGQYLNGVYNANGSVVRVGVDAVNVVVKAVNSGIAVNGAVLQVTIEEGDGEIAPCANVTSRAVAVTTFLGYEDGGLAIFFISLTKIRAQGEQFRFRIASQDVPSVFVVTLPVTAYSVVAQVNVSVQPAASAVSGGAVLVGDTARRGIASLVQPVVVLRDAYGGPVQGVAVEPVMVSCGTSDVNETALLEFTPGVSDERGVYVFSDLHVLAATTGPHCMRFGALGIFSALSPSFQVYDTSDPNLSSYDNLELFLGLSLLAAIPLMLFNSRRIRARWAIVLSYVLALGVMVGLVTFLGIVITTPGIAFGSSSDPLVIMQLTITLAVVVITLLVLLWVGIKACRGKREFHDTQLEMYREHVRLLLRPVTDPKLLREAAKREERKRRQTAAAAARKRWAEQPELSWLARALRLLWVEAADVLIMARDDYLLDVTYMDYGKHLRTNLRFSARFLTVAGVGFLTVLVGAMACAVVILAVDNGLAQAKVGGFLLFFVAAYPIARLRWRRWRCRCCRRGAAGCCWAAQRWCCPRCRWSTPRAWPGCWPRPSTLPLHCSRATPAAAI